jgi:peptide/nickel transport system substrate-binding protein
LSDTKSKETRTDRRKFLKYGAAAVVAVGVVGGAAYYGLSAPPSAPPPITATMTATVVSTVAQTGPQYGGILKYYIPSDPGVGNPAVSGEMSTMDMAGALFDRLMMRDWNLNPLPDLAETWSISPDGKTLTFNLRKNVQWHDGTPFTADDVVFTYMEAFPKYLPNYGAYYANILDSVKALDPYTVQFTLKTPYPDIMVYLSSVQGGSIIPKHIYEGTDIATNPYNTKPIGTGPFKFESWEKGVSIVLKRNDNYFIKGKPYLDGIVYPVIGQVGAFVPAYTAGEVDFFNFGTPEEALPLTTAPDTVVVTIAVPWVPVWKVQFNLRNDKLKDKRVRQALWYATDRQAILNTVWSGVGTVPISVVGTSSYTGKWVNKNVKQYPYDTATAEKLLDDAGFPKGANGTRFKLNLSYPAAAGSPHERTCFLLKDQWSKVGIDANLESLDFAFFADQVFKSWNFETSYPWYNGGPTIADAIGYLQTSMINKAWFTNPMGWSNQRFDELYVQQQSETDETKRKAMVDEMQTLVMEDPPELYINNASNVFVYRKTFEGLPAPLGLPTEWYGDIWLRH